MIFVALNVNLLTVMLTKFFNYTFSRTFSTAPKYLSAIDSPLSKPISKKSYYLPITPSEKTMELARFINQQNNENGHVFIFDSEPNKDVDYINTLSSLYEYCAKGAIGCTVAAKYPRVALGHAYILSYKANRMPVKLVAGADYNSNVQSYCPEIDLQATTFFQEPHSKTISTSYEETHSSYQSIATKANKVIGPIIYATHNSDHWELAKQIEPTPRIAVLYGAHNKLANFVKQNPQVKGMVYLPVGDDGGFYNNRRLKEIIAPKSSFRDCLINSKKISTKLVGNITKVLSKFELSDFQIDSLNHNIFPIAKQIEKSLFTIDPKNLKPIIKELTNQNLSPYINPLLEENASSEQCTTNLDYLKSTIPLITTPTIFALKPSSVIPNINQ